MIFGPCVGTVIYVTKKIRYRMKIKKTIMENTIPRRVYIKDFLIAYCENGEYEVYPIVEDRLTNKFYITYGDANFSYCPTATITIPGGYYDYDVFLGGEKLKIGDAINIYIGKELERVKIENEFININNKNYQYIGSRKEGFKRMETNDIVNENNNNFLEEIKELICYEGFIERVNYD